MNLHPWTVLPNLRNSDHCLDITQTNDGIKATKLQPLSQEPHGAADGEQGGCKLSLKAALSQEFHSYIY